jgi:hypothetical protein
MGAIVMALTGLQHEIVALLVRVGDMDAEDIRNRLCIASTRKFDEALQGLKRAHVVIYRGQANDGCWRLVHNPLTE